MMNALKTTFVKTRVDQNVCTNFALWKNIIKSNKCISYLHYPKINQLRLVDKALGLGVKTVVKFKIQMFWIAHIQVCICNMEESRCSTIFFFFFHQHKSHNFIKYFFKGWNNGCHNIVNHL